MRGIDNKVKLCGNLTWVRSAHSFDQYHFEEIEKNQTLKKSIHESIYELWNLCTFTRPSITTYYCYQIIVYSIYDITFSH